MLKRNNGITLITLTITVIVLIILASITTYSGINTIKSSKLTKYKAELEILQAQVDLLYEKYKDTTEEINIGKQITSDNEEKVKKALNTINVEDTDGYKIFDKEVIQELGIEGIEDTFIVNIREREVLSLEPFKYEGKEYYNLAQLTGERRVTDKLEREDVTFSVQGTDTTDGWKIELTDIKFSKYVGKGKVQYQNATSGKWITVEENLRDDNYSFEITEKGDYKVKVIDAAGKTGERDVSLIPYIDVELPARVTYINDTDRTIISGQFKFYVTNPKSEIKPSADFFTNDEDGNIVFKIRLYGEGEHKFQVCQVSGEDPDITYDEGPYDITVVIVEKENGDLEVKDLYAQSGPEIDQTGGNYCPELVFKNFVMIIVPPDEP